MKLVSAFAIALVTSCAADPLTSTRLSSSPPTSSPPTSSPVARSAAPAVPRRPTTTTAQRAEPTPSSTTRPLGPPAALLTPTGIPVAVLASDPAGHLVRSPCGNEVRVSAGTPLRNIAVVIDPGHGGAADTGAVGANGLVERDLNLVLAQRLGRELDERGLANVLTRTDGYATNIVVRSALADGLGAELLVSVHHNGPAGSPSTFPGTEVFVQTASEDSARLGALLYEEVTTALARFDVPWSRFADAGVLEVLLPDGRDAYGIVRNPETTAVLIEMGNLANPAEAEFFASDEYIEAASTALADGIDAYLDTDRRGTGYGNAPRVFRPAREPGLSLCQDPPLE